MIQLRMNTTVSVSIVRNRMDGQLVISRIPKHLRGLGIRGSSNNIQENAQGANVIEQGREQVEGDTLDGRKLNIFINAIYFCKRTKG